MSIDHLNQQNQLPEDSYILMKNDILTSTFQQLLVTTFFPLFLLDNNNRERKRKRENKNIMRV